jgi:hypothetical protein
MPRGKKELAERIIPKLREVDVGELSRSAGSGYDTEVSIEPHEAISYAGVVEDAGGAGQGLALQKQAKSGTRPIATAAALAHRSSGAADTRQLPLRHGKPVWQPPGCHPGRPGGFWSMPAFGGGRCLQ